MAKRKTYKHWAAKTFLLNSVVATRYPRPHPNARVAVKCIIAGIFALICFGIIKMALGD